MKDLALRLVHRPGTLGEMAAALGAAGVSLEGGGVFVVDGVATAHFLVSDDHAGPAETALRSLDGIDLLGVRDVLLTRLRQDVPGQLGALCSALGDAGVSIETQYSDHDGRLVLLVDHPARAAPVLEAWRARE